MLNSTKEKRQIKPKSEFQKQLKQLRKETPRHILEIELETTEQQRRQLLAISEELRQIRNTTVNYIMKNYNQMTRLKNYKQWKTDYKTISESLEKSNTRLVKLNQQLANETNKETLKVIRQQVKDLKTKMKELEVFKKEISQQLESLRLNFELEKSFIVDYAADLNRKTFKKPDSVTVLALAEKLWTATERLLYGETKSLSFYRRGELVTLQGKQAHKSIMLKLNEKTQAFYIEHQKMKFGFLIKDNDLFIQETLANILTYRINSEVIDQENVSHYLNDKKYMNTYRACHNRIVLKQIRGKLRVYVQMTLEGNPVPKRKSDGSFRHTSGIGRIGIDIGTSTVAYVSKEKAVLKNLAERSVKRTFKQERELIRLQRKLDRSRRAMNPENFNSDGTIKRGVKLNWTVSNRYRQTQQQLKELHRIKAMNRKLAINEEINQIRALGHEVIIEPMNFKALQKCSKQLTQNNKGKFNKRKRFGKSLLHRNPGYFVAQLEKVFKQTHGNVLKVPIFDYRASQYDHLNGAFEKKKLSKRWHIFETGEKVQRDLYSAFLLYCANETAQQIDTTLCLKEYDQFKINHDLCIEKIIQNKQKVLNSGIQIV